MSNIGLQLHERKHAAQGRFSITTFTLRTFTFLIDYYITMLITTYLWHTTANRHGHHNDHVLKQFGTFVGLVDDGEQGLFTKRLLEKIKNDLQHD